MAALDDLIAIYKEAQLALIKIITGNTGAGTKTYYNTILRQLTALLNQLAAQTGRYISTEIPKEYKAALEQTYDYFKRNNLQMNRPEMFAQIHSDAVSELAAEMQHHINEGISSAGRRVMRYANTARDNALRQNGLRASAVKIASAQTVRDMQKDLIRRLSEDGFLTVQYGSGKYAYQVGLDSYAAMVARSTTREAGNLAREKQLLANGYDLVIITEHKPCCELCARVQGRVFSISGKDKRFPPLSAAFTSGYRNVHPNCRCVAVPWIEEMQSPEELRAAIAKGSQPLRDERSDKEKALYTQQQSDRRQMRADLIQYERYKARLGSDAPQTFSAFRRVKNAGGDRWEALQREYRQKFEKVDIADNAKTTKPVEKASAVELWETENYKNSTEKGLLILPDGTTKDFGGIEHHVTGKEEDIKLMDGATFTHNHPTDNTFSQNDIVTGLVKGNLKEMRAVTSTGDVHILVNNGATEQQRKKFNVDYQQRRMKAANTADAKIRRGEKINKDEYVKSRLETFMAEHAEEYNLSYSKTRIDVNKQSIDKSAKNGIIEEREELPRKIKSGSNTVDWSIVQSEEYSKKYTKLSDDERVSSAIEIRAKWALNNRNGKNTEELYAISLKDGREVSRITDQNYDSAVKRTSKFTRELNAADESGEEILLLHNHPRGLPPSISDINALLKNKNVSGITVGHNGSIYRYTRPNKEIPLDEWNVAMKHFKEFSETTAMEKSLEILSRKFEFIFEKI